MMLSLRKKMVLQSLSIGCLLLSSFAGHSAPQEGVIFDKSMPGIKHAYGPPDYVYSEMRRQSPDGKYVAQLIVGDAEIGVVTVYRNRPHAKRLAKSDIVSKSYFDVNSCAWVPGHGHWLIVTTGGADYGEGMLALWSDPKHARLLRKAKSDAGEGYDLCSISPDGKTIFYSHFGLNRAEEEDNPKSRLHLTLPNS